MEVPRADTQAHVAPEPPKQAPKQAPKKQTPAASRVPSIIVGLLVVAVAGLSIWYLVRGEPLLEQGEVDATRLDIAARVDGRVAEIPVERGQNVAAGAVLVKIDNPRADVAEAQANHDAAVAGPTKEERAIADAQVIPRSPCSSGGSTRPPSERQPTAPSA
jgi:HlyD family secretion protein